MAKSGAQGSRPMMRPKVMMLFLSHVNICFSKKAQSLKFVLLPNAIRAPIKTKKAPPATSIYLEELEINFSITNLPRKKTKRLIARYANILAKENKI